eukprot:TRINITY_DN29352_c0_g1_i1.p1 TRINITY_DN29352_c0_g1~~TRINITY_DN29352_c0_g1_i1.p1  ORF type:complete len:319 (-),score=49.90 TRINITY_DN29352_c0_g1_i1:62-1018(-)
MGDFQKPGMLYLLTSNDDRRSSASEPMWVIESNVKVRVHLNFRGEAHVEATTDAFDWLHDRGWHRNEHMKSAATSGFPRGVYEGPIFSRDCEPGRIELMGSETWEGVYFVFVEQKEMLGPALAASAASREQGTVVSRPSRRPAPANVAVRSTFAQSLLELPLGAGSHMEGQDSGMTLTAHASQSSQLAGVDELFEPTSEACQEEVVEDEVSVASLSAGPGRHPDRRVTEAPQIAPPTPTTGTAERSPQRRRWSQESNVPSLPPLRSVGDRHLAETATRSPRPPAVPRPRQAAPRTQRTTRTRVAAPVPMPKRRQQRQR